jgi:hypothetical protein
MFETVEDQWAYIEKNYKQVTDSRIDDSHWDLVCTKCKMMRGFQVIRRAYAQAIDTHYGKNHFRQDLSSPEAPVSVSCM